MMMLPATAVMKAWTPPVKIPITFPWAACVCMFAAMALTMSPSSVCIELMMSPSNISCKKVPPLGNHSPERFGTCRESWPCRTASSPTESISQ